MSDSEEPADSKQDPHPVYVPPGIAWEEWLDVNSTLVMACTKVNPLLGPPCDQGVGRS